ncbi:restriction endonuclease subunit S [uncultured Microbulbifer sp.]|uniref:restriction endonuclease subunit S n=1 Tax=uncultured Microbulbifer sp. TaxID=348147 RepID=UPI002633B9CF|nr:restriction endonuclease subunit S [uncultured Microbulbifer sp.]
MVSEWQQVKLKEITSKLGDGLHGTPNYSEDGGYYFINGNNLSNGIIIFNEKTKRVDSIEFKKYKKELGDKTILVSINGTIGNIAYYNNEKIILGKSACYFNVDKDVDKRFVRYVLQDYRFQNYIDAFANGTTIKNVSLKTMREFEFSLPDSETQTKIANILDGLDRKIQLNRQTNQTLEQMAQALFKSWFVDFDPVIDNALAAGNPIPDALQARAQRRQQQLAKPGHKPLPEAIRQHFPCEFEHSEALGWVPKGWKVETTKSISTTNSLSWSKKNAPESVDYVDLGNAKKGQISESKKYDFSEAPSRAKRILELHDTIIGLVRPANRSFAYVDRPGLTGSTGFAVMKPNHKNLRAYLYLHLTRDEVVDEFARIADGAAYPAIRPDVVTNQVCLVPNDLILAEFQKISGEKFERIRVNNHEIDTLSQVRDVLLPKLISGELRIPDVQKEVSDAVA